MMQPSPAASEANQQATGRKEQAMKATSEAKQKVLSALIENGYSFCYYGVRTDDALYEVGDELPESRSWDDNNPTGEILPGTCATGFGSLWYDDDDAAAVDKTLALQEDYVGDHQYLIAGDRCTYGDDIGEIIIERAVVVAVIR